MKKFLHIIILSCMALCFSGCWGWFVPYSFQPSFWQFKEICQLDPEIYQANGGKIDEEYYNKVLAYFDTSLDTMSDVKTLRISDDKNTFHICLKNGLEIESLLIFLFGSKMKKLRKTTLRKLAFMFGGET